MTVRRDKDGFLEIHCDVTGEVEELGTKEWGEIGEKKRELGWKSRKQDGEWIDISPSAWEDAQDGI